MASIEKQAVNFGERRELMVTDGIRVTYRFKSNSQGILVGVYHGTKRIGSMDAYTGYSKENKCQEDIEALAIAYPEVVDRWGKFKILKAYGSLVAEEYRGKHIGRAMYLAIAREWFEENGAFLFMPSECGSIGSTSADAKRVWRSLANTLPASGNVILINKKVRVPSDL